MIEALLENNVDTDRIGSWNCHIHLSDYLFLALQFGKAEASIEPSPHQVLPNIHRIEPKFHVYESIVLSNYAIWTGPTNFGLGWKIN